MTNRVDKQPIRTSNPSEEWGGAEAVDSARPAASAPEAAPSARAATLPARYPASDSMAPTPHASSHRALPNVVSEQRLIPGTKISEVVLRTTDGRTQIARSGALGGWGRLMALNGSSNLLFRNEYMALEHRLDKQGISQANPADNYVGGKDLIGGRYRGSDLGGSDFMLFNCKGAEQLQTPSGKTFTTQDHGPLWSTPANVVTLPNSDGGEDLVTTWRVKEGEIDCTFVRNERIRSDGTVEAKYTLTNHGELEIPDYWSTHDMFPLDQDTRYALPNGTKIKVHATAGDVQLDLNAEHCWPMLKLAGKDEYVDMSDPESVKEKHGNFACKIFTVDYGGPVELKQKDESLTLAGDGEVGIWINCEGWTSDSARGNYPDASYQNTPVERSNCRSDSAAEGIANGEVGWLPRGASKTFTVTYAAQPTAAAQ